MPEIRSIGVLSVAKMVAAISLIVGFIVAVLTVLFSLLAVAAMPFFDIPLIVSGGGIVMALVIFVLTILYAVLGFIAGAVIAVIYNIAASIFGGIEVNLASPLLTDESDEDVARSYD
jgi:hypothetical protein